MHGIIYWGPADRLAAATTGFTQTVGLIRADGTPKPAYSALKRLIREEWWTRWEGTADQAGTVRLSAFYGDYRLTVTLPGGEQAVLPFQVTAKDEHIRLRL